MGDTGLDHKTGADEEKDLLVRMKFTEERQRQRAEKIVGILAERSQKKQTPNFVPEYFHSFAGNGYLAANPPEPPSEEVMTRMKQRIERNKLGKERAEGEGDGQSVKGSNINDASIERSNDLVMVGDNMEDKDNPIVALEPDDNLKQGSAFLGSKKAGTSIGPDGSLQDLQ